MIEKLIQKSNLKLNNPIVLKDCTIYFNLDYYEVDNVFLFKKESTVSCSTVGELWISGKIKSNYSYLGYCITKFHTLKHFNIPSYLEQYPSEQIIITGNINKQRVYVHGVSVSKSTIDFENGLIFNFNFQEIEYRY